MQASRTHLARMVHYSFRNVLHSLADNHINQSATDAGYSEENRKIIKGAVVNNYSQLLSVAAMKGIVYNIDRAAKVIIRHNGRDLSRRGSLTTGRAEVLLSSALGADFDSVALLD